MLADPRLDTTQEEFEELNRFLLKWLRFCTYQGHIFLVATTSANSDADTLVRTYQPRSKFDAPA